MQSVLRLAAIGPLVLLAVATGCDRATPAARPAVAIRVTCQFRFGPDREEKTFEVSIPANGTAADALLAAAGQNGWDVVSRGSGATFFVQSIDGIQNQGAGGPNWVFLVNNELAGQSAGNTRLSAGDIVLWRFGSYP